MDKAKFKEALKKVIGTIMEIGEDAANLHDIECNQKYGGGKPYSFHLRMVANYAIKWCYLVCEDEQHIVPIIFGAYFHDAIEDARQTYNDIMETAKKYMRKDQARIATEIVYALTDEKGRNRAERGSEKHYEDIRNTQYAPFIKFCDRYSNWKYSVEDGSGMAKVYEKEMPGFIEKIGGTKFVPKELIDLIDIQNANN